jgi:FMN-binding domain
MRRITLWLTSTVAVLVLLFSYRTSTSGPDRGNAVSSGGNGAGIVSSPAPATTGGGTGATPTPNSTGSGTGSGNSGGSGGGAVVVNGSTAQTRWGPVQVQVTITGGKITEITVLQQPKGNREDQQINSYALPQLREQVLTAQSANIDGVSGATVTSDGYRESLQAALDAAHFGT